MLRQLDNGILYMLLSALISALNGALTKILSDDISALEIVFFRNMIGIFLILYALRHTPPKLGGGKFHLLFTRGFFGFVAMILFFYTITIIPLGEAITLNKTSPFFVTILAFYLLGEKLSPLTLLALLIGFIGVILIVKPFGMSLSYEHILGVLGGFFAAAAYTTIKKIKDIYDSRVIVLSFVSVGTLLPAMLFLTAPFVEVSQSLAFLFPEFILPSDTKVWFYIGVMAIISTLSQWLLTKAYSAKKLSVVGVISYTNIPFAIGFGFLLGDAFPDTLTFLGISLIILGGILVSRKKA
ncbi:DMT family transporter [Sulfurimonas sp. C5]|uniref:DMT family transporter n=1 Tax=Sulfurimonas sp. C5 TaxID=3036947 RepID=UPI0024562C70|nr:DMT family transporter [Sulfurimonas sp. C5]MDH4945242.1 DMT family transporter [Sulfurimonas sp. C5]